MKFGFDEVSTSAIKRLSEDGFRVVPENHGTKWAVYTDQITSDLEGRDIDEPTHTFGVVDSGQSDYQHDAASAIVASDVHWFYHKSCTCGDNQICLHDNLYYYLFGSSVYVRHQERTLIPPRTVSEFTILMLVEDPGSLRDVLLSFKPNVKGMLF
jgi:hypothetical protein